MVMENAFTAVPTPKRVLRYRSQLRTALRTMAIALDSSGKTTAPISLPCSYADLCRLGLSPLGAGVFLFQAHPVKALQAPCNGSVPSRDPAQPEQHHAVASLWRREPVGEAETSQLQAASPGEGAGIAGTGCLQDAGGMYSAQEGANGVRRAEARRREGLAATGLVPRTSSDTECKPDPKGGTH